MRSLSILVLIMPIGCNFLGNPVDSELSRGCIDRSKLDNVAMNSIATLHFDNDVLPDLVLNVSIATKNQNQFGGQIVDIGYNGLVASGSRCANLGLILNNIPEISANPSAFPLLVVADPQPGEGVAALHFAIAPFANAFEATELLVVNEGQIEISRYIKQEEVWTLEAGISLTGSYYRNDSSAPREVSLTGTLTFVGPIPYSQ